MVNLIGVIRRIFRPTILSEMVWMINIHFFFSINTNKPTSPHLKPPQRLQHPVQLTPRHLASTNH